MPLTDRSTSKLGQSLVDGFAADRILRVLARIERTQQVSESDKRILGEGVELVSRLAGGDPVLGRTTAQRRTLGMSPEAAGKSVVLRENISDAALREVEDSLNLLLQGEVPSQERLAMVQGFFLEMAKRILEESESLNAGSSGPRRFVAWRPSLGGVET